MTTVILVRLITRARRQLQQRKSQQPRGNFPTPAGALRPRVLHASKPGGHVEAERSERLAPSTSGNVPASLADAGPIDLHNVQIVLERNVNKNPLVDVLVGAG